MIPRAIFPPRGMACIVLGIIALCAIILLSSCTTFRPPEYHEARLAARLLSLSPPEGKAKANRPRFTLSHTIPF
jgi:hypothetical protein